MRKHLTTTLFMLMSVDGKISTGESDDLDFDEDLKNIAGVREGLEQYYDIEKKTDLYSLISGKVLKKIGVNEGKMLSDKIPVTFIVVDNQPHLQTSGIHHLLEFAKGVILVTTHTHHPIGSFDSQRVQVIQYQDAVDFKDLFLQLERQGIRRLTIQSGGLINGQLVRYKLIDRLSIVVAPLLVGGANTPTLVDGTEIKSKVELSKLLPLELVSVKELNNSYLHLKYKVRNSFDRDAQS